ncbi:GNAT family N-acetyltransferase [Halobacillus aidingensis]|uniref:Acetyltransferase (GNAT) family protein n=1 Tax=Halobacillus aidingensis TaxID=240303 RepID=A0A1H0LPV7_HALAD|nr:GNAT family N-acetyltransferase [Halobacillus aidingensis]SDO70207.1 Acetyltransferase (GNAT) family protein [Halobacillus aidingensis]
MKKIINPFIKLKSIVDQDDYEDILALKNLCLEKENVTLKLELDYKLSKAANERKGIDRINEFMFYDEGTLIGYIGICQFGAQTLEVNGMVHPEYRRMGIFTRLFSLVRDEWLHRDSQQMLLLCDRHSSSGIEFIKRMGAVYEHSEYEMFFTNEGSASAAIESIKLRKAQNEDAKEIARQNAIFFQVSAPEDGLKLPEEESMHGVDTFMVERNQSVIGKVHLEVHNGVGGIYGLGVLPEYRRKGYGRDILMKAVEILKEKQVQQIMLQVAVKNNHALNLYRSCGFEETSTMDYYKLTKK